MPVSRDTPAVKASTHGSRRTDSSAGIWSCPRRHDEAQRPGSHEEPGQPAQRGEQHALHEELPQEPAPARAERGPDGQLALTVGGAREQQVHDVHPRDEQDEAHRAEEEEQGGPHVLHDEGVEGHEEEPAVAVLDRVQGGQARRDAHRPRTGPGPGSRPGASGPGRAACARPAPPLPAATPATGRRRRPPSPPAARIPRGRTPTTR